MGRLLKDWTRFEFAWLLTFTAINVYLFFAWNDTLLGLISSLTGMLCVVLVAKGKISNYYFGIINTGTYAFISYTSGLYGEAILNAFFYFPIQFIGIYLWSKNKTKVDVQGEDVIVNSLSRTGWFYTLSTVVVGIIGFGYFLIMVKGNNVWVDSATTVLSVAAQILMLKRFTEQWLFWIAVNALSIVLWVTTITADYSNDYTMVVMWTAFLINSIYGYFNWKKMNQTQEKEEVK